VLYVYECVDDVNGHWKRDEQGKRTWVLNVTCGHEGKDGSL